MSRRKIIILGAGLAGLSAAWHLQKKGITPLIFEKEKEAGGLCRSKNLQGFTFDYCGHLLHFKYRYTFDLIRDLLKDNLLKHRKNAWIYSHDRFTRYPFQANLYGLPKSVIKECLLGFIEVNANSRFEKKTKPSFLNWINHTFGEGIARHFMIPYNTKFWTVSPSELTCKWFDGFIPVPTLRDILSGTIGENKKVFGYNAIFWYPKKGGIQEIPRILSSRIRNIHTLYEAEQIDLKNKQVYFKNGKKYRYDILFFTLPLPEISNLCRDLPVKIITSLQRLRYNSIFNLNLGIDKRNISDRHWIYFPEKNFIFFRAGFPSNFSSESVPPNASSLYIEVAYSKEKPIDKNTIVQRIIKDLTTANIISPLDKILVKDINDIKYGYIIYDRLREEAVGKIKKFLNKNNIFSLGRYGSWSYLSMEDVLWEGRRVADIL
jgi:UDP-galactopyranose mutase